MTLIYYAWITIKKLNKLVNADIKDLADRLNADKISLHVKKTEIVIFKSTQKKYESDLKARLCVKRLAISHRNCKIPGSQNWCKPQLVMSS